MLKKTGVGIVVKQHIIQGKYKVLHILSEHGRWSGIYSFNTHAIDLLTEIEFIWTGKSIEALGTHQCYNPTHFLPITLMSEQFSSRLDVQDNQFNVEKHIKPTVYDLSKDNIYISDQKKATEHIVNKTNTHNQKIDKHINNHQIYLVAITLCELAMLIPERQSDKELWYHFKHARALLLQSSLMHSSVLGSSSSSLINTLFQQKESASEETLLTHDKDSYFFTDNIIDNINNTNHLEIDIGADYIIDSNKINNLYSDNQASDDSASLQIEAWMRFESALLDIDITPQHINNPKEFFKQSSILLNMQYPDVKFFRARNYLYKTL